jgi:hypothetical protein
MGTLPYWKKRQLEKMGMAMPPEHQPVKPPSKYVQLTFFKKMQAAAPERCENCGCYLGPTKAIHPSAHIAHILPKRHFYSVAINPRNIWYGCMDCHQDYDRSWTKAETMPVFNTVVVQRYKGFMEQIHPTEHKHLPPTLLNILNHVDHNEKL